VTPYHISLVVANMQSMKVDTKPTPSLLRLIWNLIVSH